MRQIPESLQASLAAGVTSLCWCWRVERRDGTVFGFTNHDRDLAFEGVTYRAASGFEAGEVSAELGFSIDSASVFGALSDAAITDADLAAGLWDEAQVTLYRVDWRAPEDRFALWRGEVGETKRGPVSFEAELRAPSHRLSQTTGRVYSRRCDAEVGDARCGVDLEDPAFRGEGGVAEVLNARAVRVSGLEGFEEGLFARGRLRWTSGGNAGLVFEVESHTGDVLTLRTAPSGPVEAGDGFVVTAGCDKRFATCRTRFANAVNFRGFPHMPGNDAILAGPSGEAVSDGGSRNRS